MAPPAYVAVALLCAWVWMMFWATTTDNTIETDPADWVETGDERAERPSESSASDGAFHTADD